MHTYVSYGPGLYRERVLADVCLHLILKKARIRIEAPHICQCDPTILLHIAHLCWSLVGCLLASMTIALHDTSLAGVRRMETDRTVDFCA